MTTIIGDSLGVGDSKYFKGKHDVKVGRNSAESLAALKRRRVGKKVVLEVGSNDPDAATLKRNLERARRDLQGRKVVIGLVNPGVADAAAKNKALKAYAKRIGAGVVRTGAGGDGIHPADYRRRASKIKKQFRGQKAPRIKRSNGDARKPLYGQHATPATSLRELVARGYSGS